MAHTMRIDAGSKLVMIGDSITDAGRQRPVADGGLWMIGNGYVHLIAGLLGAVCPEQTIRLVNMGVSGNTVRDLKARWQTDVLDLQPDWLSIMIGINDVWRQFDLPAHRDRHVRIEEYEETLGELVQATRPRLNGLVLMTPYFVEPNRQEPMRALMDQYGMVVRRIAAEHDAIFVDTQAAFDEVLRHLHPSTVAADRVHPNIIGHTVIARAFLDAVGFAWSSAGPSASPAL